ncbi:hypothetical protein PHPALM_10724, partial [Phytophthora palmivora]
MEQFDSAAFAMNTDLSDLLDDFGSVNDTLLSEEVLDLPDLELLLPSDDLDEELLNSLVLEAENEENCSGAMESEEEKEGLTVSVDDPLISMVEEQKTELMTREIK